MREQDVNHLRTIVRKILAPSQHPTRSDAVAFLILVRELAPPKGPLRDLGDAAAHGKRTKGTSFDYLNKYSLNLRRVFIHGGRLRTSVVAPIRDVIIEINGVLGRLGVKERLPRDDAVIAQKTALMIGNALNDTTYELRVAKGLLRMSLNREGQIMMSASVQFYDDIVGALPLSKEVAIACGWLFDGPFEPLPGVLPPGNARS